MKVKRLLLALGALNLALLTPAVLLGQGTTASSVSAEESAAKQSAASSQPRGPEPKGPVPRFGIIWEGKLTRSGKPKQPEGWKWMRERGVKTIVNFRASNDVDYKSFGFADHLWIPLDNGRLPTEAEAEKYLGWIQEPANQPVNIQCAEGKDRTGMMAALARYAIEAWPLDEAIKESSLYRRGEPISDERIGWLRDWAKKHPPGSHRKR
ncbi:MAG TPA: tyrosine-protein phosphatase [Pyrinomonadaceae bacterium]|nr:tyrosine-protein phosphatase [Pyrinomonadaceae bacterium]